MMARFPPSEAGFLRFSFLSSLMYEMLDGWCVVLVSVLVWKFLEAQLFAVGFQCIDGVPFSVFAAVLQVLRVETLLVLKQLLLFAVCAWRKLWIGYSTTLCLWFAAVLFVQCSVLAFWCVRGGSWILVAFGRCFVGRVVLVLGCRSGSCLRVVGVCFFLVGASCFVSRSVWEVLALLFGGVGCLGSKSPSGYFGFSWAIRFGFSN
ncbi:hypothetical protein VNO80_30487 [Phaseolus coccineus]|uniref:Transmembrane protein n=1 Tax=Phaseolus coccineus TaxID=3886 RepID=A0AAN9QDH9_PHACN